MKHSSISDHKMKFFPLTLVKPCTKAAPVYAPCLPDTDFPCPSCLANHCTTFRKGGRKEGGKEGGRVREIKKGGREGGRGERRKEGRKREGNKEGREVGRGRKEGKKEGRKEEKKKIRKERKERKTNNHCPTCCRSFIPATEDRGAFNQLFNVAFPYTLLHRFNIQNKDI